MYALVQRRNRGRQKITLLRQIGEDTKVSLACLRSVIRFYTRPGMNATIGAEQLTKIAQNLGLDIVAAFNPALTLGYAEARHAQWLKSGYAGEMTYLERAHTSMKRILPAAQSALVFSIKYASPSPKALPHGYGRIARYAWGKDYHRVLPKLLKMFVLETEKVLGTSIIWKAVSDATPLLEKPIASMAGIGFIGKNSLVIRPGVGSYTFLCELIWDLHIEGEFSQSRKTTCGSCQNCMDCCPTKAIGPSSVVDSRRCISYLTIEKRGALSIEERGMLGGWLFGCDICQEVCPFNHTVALKKPAPSLMQFSPEFGAGEILRLEDLFAIQNDEEYLEQFAGTPLMRAKREGLLRNAICVAANTGVQSAADSLIALLENDPSLIIRQHAAWAMCVLSRNEPLKHAHEVILKRSLEQEEMRPERSALEACGLL
jgi:epoxyqueuosine reductase